MSKKFAELTHHRQCLLLAALKSLHNEIDEKLHCHPRHTISIWSFNTSFSAPPCPFTLYPDPNSFMMYSNRGSNKRWQVCNQVNNRCRMKSKSRGTDGCNARRILPATRFNPSAPFSCVMGYLLHYWAYCS